MVPRQSITLDVGRRRRVIRDRVTLGEGDVNGTMLAVTVTEDGMPFGIAEYVPYLMIPMGDSVYRQEGESCGNTALIQVDESRLSGYVGLLTGAYVSLEADGIVTSTQRFDVEVLESAGTTEIEDQIADLTAQVVESEERIAALIEEYEARIASIIEEYEARIAELGGE